MPFTPFHFGPAALLKALFPARFSFLIFCYAQVVTDVEVAYYLWLGDAPFHRFSHTYAGAAAVGIICGVTGPWLRGVLVRWFKKSSVERFIVDRLTLKISLLSALIGTFSHVLLDSIMHHDIEPFRPWSGANGIQGAMPLSVLHVFCMSSGMVGLIVVEVLTKAHQKGRRHEADVTDAHESKEPGRELPRKR